MKINHMWFKHNGDCLEGKKAYEYMKLRQNQANELMKDVQFLLDQMEKLNTFKDVLGDPQSEDFEYFSEENTFGTLCDSLENLSLISMLAEELINLINEVLEND